MNQIEYQGQFYESASVIETLKSQVTPQRWLKIQSIVDRRNKNLATVLENIYDRGNSSAVMRSAEAFGFYQIHHINENQDFKESKRVTQGADKWLVQKKWPDTLSCVQSLKLQGFKIYVTQLNGGRPIQECSFQGPVALCFGNEKDGVSPLLSEWADEKVFIPMQGFVQSFNISVAAALSFQYVYLKTREAGGPPPLSGDERHQLLAQYLLKSCKNPRLA